jgi:opacity protein-like surface antigen
MARGTKSVNVVVGFLCALLVVAAPASAEWFGEYWVGVSQTQDEDLKIRILDVSATDEVDYSTSFTVGVRVGYWFASAPWLGLALDISYLKPDPDLTMFPISTLVMLRAPLLKSDEFPHGRIQPYLGGGPGLFVTYLATDLGAELGGPANDTSVDIGFDVRGGIAFQITREFAIFTEYRFTRVSPEWDLRVLDLDAKAETDLNTHSMSVGVSFRF